ncbi:APC family permease [Streptomyces sp. NPDC058762]|uniref:APC family permease n=1 Tax=Streptomyces sp. NPDC058762 TaxID=3346629 RepID=UPI0036CDDFFE
MAGRVRNAGAFYAYVQAGPGRIPGLSAATLALFSYVLLLVGVNAYVGVATSNVIERYADVGSPWWLWAFVSLGIIAFLGYRDIELSAKVLGAVLVLESLLLLVMDFGILGHGGAHSLTAEPLSPSIVGNGSLGLGVMFAIFGFIGFEATAVFRNESKDPDVTVPRATCIAILVIGVFYSFTVWAIVVGVGVDAVTGAAKADPEGLVLTLARSYVGSVWAHVMRVLLITSQFACVLAFHNVVTRYQFVLSRAGALPAPLGVVPPPGTARRHHPRLSPRRSRPSPHLSSADGGHQSRGDRLLPARRWEAVGVAHGRGPGRGLPRSGLCGLPATVYERI